MNQIEVFYTGHLRKEDIQQFYTGCAQLITHEMANEVGLGKLWEAFAADAAALEAVRTSYHGFRKTKEVLRKWKIRNRRLQFLFKMLEAWELSSDEAKAEAAHALLIDTEKGRNAAKHKYFGSIALTNAIVRTCRDEKHAQGIALLGLEVAVDELEVANADFTTVYETRSCEIAILREDPTVVALRARAKVSSRAFFEAVNTIYASNELIYKDKSLATKLETIIDIVNAQIGAARMAQSRHGRRKTVAEK